MTNVLTRAIALFLLIFSLPLLFLIWVAIKIEDGGPFFFKQKRAGKNKKPFTIYKIKTMVKRAEEQKEKYRRLNEADGPVFKIHNDPRYTKVGKFIAHTGLDELPQLINIIKGEMAFVGTRPLPLDEAAKVPNKYEKRFSILPGITSLWVIKGSHQLSFDDWMRFDLEYIKERKSFLLDVKIVFLTLLLILRGILSQIVLNEKDIK
jgi:lipopolysaccharide/colanic/teichoic acid biosynthesis glycosyltransferase